jgi:hypothetical protein
MTEKGAPRFLRPYLGRNNPVAGREGGAGGPEAMASCRPLLGGDQLVRAEAGGEADMELNRGMNLTLKPGLALPWIAWCGKVSNCLACGSYFSSTASGKLVPRERGAVAAPTSGGGPLHSTTCLTARGVACVSL